MCDEELIRRIRTAANWKGLPQTNPTRLKARQAARTDFQNGNSNVVERLRQEYEIARQCSTDPTYQRQLERAVGIARAAYQAEMERLHREANEAKVKQQNPNGHGPFSAHKRKKKKDEWVEELDG